MGIWDKMGVENSSVELKRGNMGEVTERFKNRYNYLIQRRLKAETWMERSDTTMEDIDKHMGSYYEIIIEISAMMKEFWTITGKKMSDDIIFNGFKEEKHE